MFCALMYHFSSQTYRCKSQVLLPPATKLGQGYIFTGVCDSVKREGGSASVHAGIPPPPPADPPWEQTPPSRPPWEQTPPRTRHPPGADTPQQTPPGADTPQDQAPPGSRHPPGAVHAGRYDQRAGGTHPTGMQSCFVGELAGELSVI